MNQEPLLKIQNLCKHYTVKSGALLDKKVLKAVDGLNIEINKGDVFGLVGESGCGKSTVGQIISGILPKTGGDIFYNGKSTDTMSKSEQKNLCKEIQMIFQDPFSALNPKKKIGWIIEEPLKIHFNYTKKERDSLVDEIMTLTGLDPELKSSYSSKLSGGQRQRVNIAASLMLGANLIVADESVSALDVSIQSQILNLFVSLKENKGLTLLFISHDLNVIKYLSNRIGVMYMGRIVETGNCDEICDNPLHPYTQMLLSAVPSAVDDVTTRIVPRGEIPNPLNPPSGCAFHTRCVNAIEKCRLEEPKTIEVSSSHKVCCHLISN